MVFTSLKNACNLRFAFACSKQNSKCELARAYCKNVDCIALSDKNNDKNGYFCKHLLNISFIYIDNKENGFFHFL